MSPFLIAGLGNPGREHEGQRHNAGFMVVNELCVKGGGSWRAKFSGRVARVVLDGRDAILLEPETYMNDSGRSVQMAAAFFQIESSDVVVVHDEMDLPLGEVRIKVGGGDAGHNGLCSVVACLGTEDFVRVRVGIGRPPAAFRGDKRDWVLSRFDAAERSLLGDAIAKAVLATLRIADKGVARAMNEINARPKPVGTGGGPPSGTGNVSASSGTSEIGVHSAWC
jgi:peptidyl-tRNA hydrolase, PTH1 family